MNIKDLEQRIDDLEYKLKNVEDKMLTGGKLLAMIIGGVIGLFIIEKIFKFFHW